jgi:hypothetical protein
MLAERGRRSARTGVDLITAILAARVESGSAYNDMS